ncbi:PREDICTED: uncharacterized protein LOC106785490 [Polistes canadensis]|uniref:uncharacterized protein LOC106785490 n=1 Tax=Polistes canadensis TaxID=91411 RepID=UPI000718C752|nr:PREDICTED: uncharacterized protein LOC106785490 [Polistes canadensis]
MAQLIQDTNITSSVAFSKSLQNDDNALDDKGQLHEKEENDVILIYESCDRKLGISKNSEVQNNKLHSTKSFQKTFSRLVTFNKIMHSSIGKRNFHLLEKLISIYINNILNFMETNYIMTYEVIKLKKHMSNTLTFFHFYWHEINEHIENHNCYLNKLSVLLAIYVDTELKTSKCSKDPSKIADKLFNALCIYLNKSREHIFKVLLRIKLITKRYAQICDYIFSKSFNNLKTNEESMTGVKYVRYLFTLKLWRQIKKDSEEAKKIDELAVALLGSHMPKMHVDLLKLVPKLPSNCKNETLWLMQPNLFDLKQACNDFLVFTENMETTECVLLPSTIKSTKVHNYTNSEINMNTNKDEEMHSLSCNKSDINPKTGLNNNKLKDNSKKNNNSIKKKKLHAKEKTGKNKKYKLVPNVKSGEMIVINFLKDNEQSQNSRISLINHDSFRNALNLNERIINPCLIKKCVEENSLNAELCSQKQSVDILDSSVQRNKNEQCVNQNNSIDRCVDIVSFGLNANAKEDFDLFSWDDNGSISMFKNISSLYSSPLLIQSDVKLSESKESLTNLTFTNSDYEFNDMKMEQGYDFQEANILKESNLKTYTAHHTSLDEVCISKDVPSSDLPVQMEDLLVPSYNCMSTSALQLDLELLPTGKLIETPNLPLSFSQYDLVSNKPITSDSQFIFTKNDNLNIQQFLNGLQSVETLERIQQNVKISSDYDQLYADQDIMEDINNFSKPESMDLDKILPQKKRISMNLRNSVIIREDISSDSNLLYKVESEDNILISTDNSCFKPSEGNITKSDPQVAKVLLVQDESSKETSTKISIKPNIRKLDTTSYNEETSSVKRRKVTSELLPLLDASKVSYSTNTQTKTKDLLSEMKV